MSLMKNKRRRKQYFQSKDKEGKEQSKEESKEKTKEKTKEKSNARFKVIPSFSLSLHP